MTGAHGWGLAVFGLLLLSATLYGLAASGHFPRQTRARALQTRGGALVLWGSMAGALLTVAVSLALAWSALPWASAVIVGGGVLLIAPLVLQLFPDSFVDGRAGLIVFAGLGAVLSLGVVVFQRG